MSETQPPPPPEWWKGSSESLRLTAALLLLETISTQLKTLTAAVAELAEQVRSTPIEPRRCKDPKCNALFTPANVRAEYHTERCRWRHSQQLRRAAPVSSVRRQSRKAR